MELISKKGNKKEEKEKKSCSKQKSTDVSCASNKNDSSFLSTDLKLAQCFQQFWLL